MLFNLIFIILDSKKSYIPDSLIIYDDYYIFLEFKKDNTDSDCGFDCWKILFYHFIFWVLKSIIHCNDEPIFIKKKGIKINLEKNFYGMFLKYDDKKNQEFKFNIQNIEISQNNDAAKIICSISKSIERIIKNKYGCITFGINFGQFNDEKINRLLSFFKNWLEKILGPNKNKSSGKIF